METIISENSLSSSGSQGVEPSAAVGRSARQLGQADFIELLVAQIQNQDPTKPLEPSQFMNQLAQFSAVNGIQELKTSFDALADRLASEQSLQAAGLVGRNVLVAGGQGLLTAGGALSGRVDLPQSSSNLDLRIVNAYGVEVRSLSLGGHEQGPVQFTWDGFADDGSAAAPGKYTVIAEALIDGNLQALEVEVEATVESITINPDGSGTLLNLASGDAIPLSRVEQIR